MGGKTARGTNVPAVKIDRLHKQYEKKTVLHSLSLEIPDGGIFGLLGPNGAGKTTLMKILAGLTRPESGNVSVFGMDALVKSPAMRQMIGLIPQDNNLERELTVEEALIIYAKLFRIADARETVEKTIVAFNLETMRNQRVRTLSGGMMRRVLIARCLMPQPRLLLLDEPTVGLDPDARQDLWTVIRGLTAKGKTVVLTTHYMEEAEKLCDRIAMLKQGELALLDTPEGLQLRFGNGLSKAENLEALFIRLAKEKD